MMKFKRLHKIHTPPLWTIASSLLLLFNIILGFNGLYGQDAFEYLRYSRALHMWLQGGPAPGPFYWPVLYPFSGAVLSYLFGDIFSLQLISILSYGITIHFLQKILSLTCPGYNKRNRNFILFFFAASPFVLRYCSVVMADSFTMMFITGFIYNWLKFREKYESRNFLLLILFASLAINTRYAAIAVVPLPLLNAAMNLIRRPGRFTWIKSVIIILAVFSPAMLLSIIGSPVLRLSLHPVPWSFLNFFGSEFSGADGYHHYFLPNLCFVTMNMINPGYIFPGIVLLAMTINEFRHQHHLSVFVFVIILYALFLAGFPTQNERFLLLTFPCVIIIYAPAWRRLLNRIRLHPVLPGILILAILTFQSALFYRAYRPFYENGLNVRHIAERIKTYPGKTVYTFNIDQGLKAYGVQNEIINLWLNSPETFRKGSLILFNYENSFVQWKDMNPMNNWIKARNHYHLQLKEIFSEGWDLYEIIG